MTGRPDSRWRAIFKHMHRILAGSACNVPSVTGMRRLWAHSSANQAILHDMGRGRAVVFLRTGGMRAIEEKAAAAAVADARELWLPTLQGWHATCALAELLL